MASRYWRGVNTTATDTTNWSATRYGATGQTVPGASDDAFFFDGDGDIAAVTAFAPATVTIGGNFRGSILGMALSTAACIVTIENVAFSKTVNIGPDASTTLAAVHVRSTGQGTVNIFAGSSGVLTLLNVGRVGRLIVDGSCPVTTFNSAGMPDTWNYSATAITTGQWSGGGTHDLQRSVTTITVDGPGTRVNVTANGGSPAFTTATASAGGSLYHDSDGTIATANAKPGGSILPVSTRYTITNTNLWEGGFVGRGSDKVTFTNAPTLIGNPA